MTALVALLSALLLLFPGPRLRMAVTIGLGVGRDALQRRIDGLEEQAIGKAPFSGDDRAFLVDFYRTLATGAKLSVVVRQTGSLMDHYLDGSGADYRLSPEIFSQNAKVQAQMQALRRRARSQPCAAATRLSSPTFYMPDASKVDSVFGLYYGKLTLERAKAVDHGCAERWRAEVPWTWPSYASLRQKYGRFHAESFPLPNLVALLLGPEHALYVDNGLGEHLAQLGLAKPFVAFAEWTDD